MSRRVAICITHPIQYFAPAFRSVAQARSLDALAFYWNAPKAGRFDPEFAREVEWDVDLLSGYRWTAARGPSVWKKALHHLQDLHRFDPEVLLVAGWATPIARVSLLWGVVMRRRILIFGDSTWQHEPRGWRRPLRSLVLRALFRTISGAFSTGTFNREFYIRFGMHPSRVHEGTLAADVLLYRSGQDRRVERHPFTIGFAGKLIPIKGADELISAAGALARSSDWEVVFIGEGPSRASLEELVDHLALTDRVRFVGFRNQSAMPDALASLDVLVVPSKLDRRVLIVAEAMAAGTPVVVSDATAVWGPGDLVEHEVSGLVYHSGDSAELAKCLQRLMCEPALARALAEEGRRRAQRVEPGRFAELVEEAVTAVCTSKSPKRASVRYRRRIDRADHG